MMHGKALLFEPEAAQAIIDAPTPAEAKALGRKIKNFDRKKWDQHADDIVERGNYLKFGEDEELKGYVEETKPKILVEASTTDRIWGIGFSAEDAPGKEDQWGANRWVDFYLGMDLTLKNTRMGLALTRARDKLIA